MLEIQRTKAQQIEHLCQLGMTSEEAKRAVRREHGEFRPAYVNGKRRPKREMARSAPSRSGSPGSEAS